jgi:hypothetical protein
MIPWNRMVSPPHIQPRARYWKFEFEQQVGFLEAADLNFSDLSVTCLDRSRRPWSRGHRRKRETDRWRLSLCSRREFAQPSTGALVGHNRHALGLVRHFRWGPSLDNCSAKFGLSNKCPVNDSPPAVSPYPFATANFFHAIVNSVAGPHWAA